MNARTKSSYRHQSSRSQYENRTFENILKLIVLVCYHFNRLELNMELPQGVQASSIGTDTRVSQEQDELSQRLARLRQTE